MEQYTRRYAWYPNASRVRPLWDRAVKELSDLGWGDPQLNYSTWLLWAEDSSGQPIGIVALAFDPVEQSIWVELAYTAPDHRRKGVYQFLFSQLVERATMRGIRYIECGIHERNEVMLQSARASGHRLEPMAVEPYVKATLVLQPTTPDHAVRMCAGNRYRRRFQTV